MAGWSPPAAMMERRGCGTHAPAAHWACSRFRGAWSTRSPSPPAARACFRESLTTPPVCGIFQSDSQFIRGDHAMKKLTALLAIAFGICLASPGQGPAKDEQDDPKALPKF